MSPAFDVERMVEPPEPHDPNGSVIQALLDSCPSFTRPWREYLDSGRGGPYIDAGVFAKHLVDCLERGATAEFPAAFGVIERLLTEGDAGIRYLVTFGLIEDLQNLASNRHDQHFAARFRPWLGPTTTVSWDEVNRVWGSSDS
jgi:hypothetical protein